MTRPMKVLVYLILIPMAATACCWILFWLGILGLAFSDPEFQRRQREINKRLDAAFVAPAKTRETRRPPAIHPEPFAGEKAPVLHHHGRLYVAGDQAKKQAE